MIKLKTILSNRLNESPVNTPSSLKAAFGDYPFAGPYLPKDFKGLGNKAKKYLDVLKSKISKFNPEIFLKDMVNRTQDRFFFEPSKNPPKDAIPIINALFGSVASGREKDWVLEKSSGYDYFEFIEELYDYSSQIMYGEGPDGDSPPADFYDILVKTYNLKPELNTEFEDKLIKVFRQWYWKSNKSSASEINAVFDLLKKARVKWPYVFKPHVQDGAPLFRGMQSVPDGTLKMLKSASVDDFQRVSGYSFDNPFYVYKTPVNYIPRMDAQSWTDKPDIALDFASDCILVTKCNTEFIMNRKFSHIWDMDEDEIIHVGTEYKQKVYIAVSEEFMSTKNKEYIKTQLSKPQKGRTNIKTVANKLVKYTPTRKK